MHMSKEGVCLNCTQELQTEFKICPYCGQATDQHRFTVGHIIHHFFHAFTHADSSALKYMLHMTIRPGKVIREYVLEGKRRKYFNPFTFLLIVLGITLFMNSIFHPFSKAAEFNVAQINNQANGLTPEQQKVYFKIMAKQANIYQFMEKRTNLLILMVTPVFSFVMWLFFRKKANYAEHLAAYVMLSGVLSLLSTFVMTPLIAMAKNQANYMLLTLPVMILQIVYVAWGYTGFLQLKQWGIVKAIVATIVANVGVFIVMFIGMMLYLLFG